MSLTTHPIRHPELVSGSISPLSRSTRRQSQPRRKIVPVRIFALDQVDLPLPMPVLQLLFAGDCALHVPEHFISDEAENGVATDKTARDALAMFVDAADKVRTNADVERAVRLAREEVDAGVALELHGPELAARWLLKQVQHDDRGWK